jgi:DNA-directed RNA polymerase subunit RPC12/RpoP
MPEPGPQPSDEGTPAAQAWCVCGKKVAIADAQEVTLPNGRPGWQGSCPNCGSRLFAIRRKPAGD